MPAAKTLAAHVRDRTFRARRHHELLIGPVVTWPYLAATQARCQATVHELERRAIGVEFERAVRDPEESRDDADDASEERVKIRAEVWAELRAIFDAPAVPLVLCDDKRRVRRYWRACRARGLRRDGLSLRDVAARLDVSKYTVHRDLRELETDLSELLPMIDGGHDRSCWARTRHRS